LWIWKRRVSVETFTTIERVFLTQAPQEKSLLFIFCRKEEKHAICYQQQTKHRKTPGPKASSKKQNARKITLLGRYIIPAF
jgi:hypothetical protein